MADLWSFAPLVISAVTGATAGGLASIVVGPTKAEREERGKRRIEARSNLGKRLRAFRYEFKKARLLRLEGRAISDEAVFESALLLAIAANAAMQALPLFERLRIRRRIVATIGVEMLSLADFQIDSDGETVSAAVHMVTEKYRLDPRESIRRLTEVDPSEPVWDKLLKRIESLIRKYS
ncbi:hypothetical protein [Saccharothrix yanglingensis]|uniref:hypothetical protein n=1 Tax=Saccharothrix yanglingensis TaxID=659496 RepID=UPI0027D33876|nr:hypothetical protein [Saccharothrix yanglingensis]